ncbi:sulfite exporter TauE/SafE family protein [Desulfitobacterium sp.]|uniref:sulfite exporter TauE/SafE family protein n=1 Tax=Desulfitobacterium sp. TaxID=49981 RepID=UPI002B203E56|nr:sulfite exporter TauE/SafE family protein [Desulfitobacterium sp.]MEA4900670.1 sulfite exporter TauE/SafE family protein [Desulfitobacterium sp.]
MYLLFFLVSFLASTIGQICGIGGGVIIKPVLDATGTMSVSAISFLSGCTVLSMSTISVLRNFLSKKEIIDIKSSTPLAIGGIIGGVLGKWIFELVKAIFQNENHLGAVQAGLLIVVTLGSLLYSVNSHKIHTRNIKNVMLCALIGLGLGMISTFLGIGGGPINLTVLFYFLSMDTKKAAANSLYIIMFSQFAGLFQTVVGGTVPQVSALILALMVFAGVVGGVIGGRINKKISAEVVDKLFIGLMIVIVGINIYNLVRFTI